MKNVLMDICLVLLILMIGSQIFDTKSAKQETLIQNVAQFEDDVVSGDIKERYTLSQETTPNKVSIFIEEVSDFSRKSVKVVVDAFATILEGF